MFAPAIFKLPNSDPYHKSWSSKIQDKVFRDLSINISISTPKVVKAKRECAVCGKKVSTKGENSAVDLCAGCRGMRECSDCGRLRSAQKFIDSRCSSCHRNCLGRVSEVEQATVFTAPDIVMSSYFVSQEVTMEHELTPFLDVSSSYPDHSFLLDQFSPSFYADFTPGLIAPVTTDHLTGSSSIKRKQVDDFPPCRRVRKRIGDREEEEDATWVAAYDDIEVWGGDDTASWSDLIPSTPSTELSLAPEYVCLLEAIPEIKIPSSADPIVPFFSIPRISPIYNPAGTPLGPDIEIDNLVQVFEELNLEESSEPNVPSSSMDDIDQFVVYPSQLVQEYFDTVSPDITMVAAEHEQFASPMLVCQTPNISASFEWFSRELSASPGDDSGYESAETLMDESMSPVILQQSPIQVKSFTFTFPMDSAEDQEEDDEEDEEEEEENEEDEPSTELPPSPEAPKSTFKFIIPANTVSLDDDDDSESEEESQPAISRFMMMHHALRRR
ncbi:hypothetical protein C8J56DRAFT_325360 [Mycena floridula]|nr:hypothetical protein C8J56DRAFT_325360 [Mycena floridula]